MLPISSLTTPSIRLSIPSRSKTVYASIFLSADVEVQRMSVFLALLLPPPTGWQYNKHYRNGTPLRPLLMPLTREKEGTDLGFSDGQSDSEIKVLTPSASDLPGGRLSHQRVKRN